MVVGCRGGSRGGGRLTAGKVEKCDIDLQEDGSKDIIGAKLTNVNISNCTLYHCEILDVVEKRDCSKRAKAIYNSIRKNERARNNEEDISEDVDDTFDKSDLKKKMSQMF